LNPDRETIKNLFAVMENILQKKTFMQLLGLGQNVIVGTK